MNLIIYCKLAYIVFFFSKKPPKNCFFSTFSVAEQRRHFVWVFLFLLFSLLRKLNRKKPKFVVYTWKLCNNETGYILREVFFYYTNGKEVKKSSSAPNSRNWYVTNGFRCLLFFTLLLFFLLKKRRLNKMEMNAIFRFMFTEGKNTNNKQSSSIFFCFSQIKNMNVCTIFFPSNPLRI